MLNSSKNMATKLVFDTAQILYIPLLVADNRRPYSKLAGLF